MKHKGTGSIISPITIDDSEEEVVMELCDVNVNPPGPTTRSQSAKNLERRILQGNVANPEAILNGHDRTKDKDVPGKTVVIPPLLIMPLVNTGQGAQKRKRTHVDLEDNNIVGSSGPKLPPSNLEARFSNPSSKKARKRRRKLERQAMETKQQFWMNGMNGLNQFLTPFSWTPPQYNLIDPLSTASPFANGNQPYPNPPQDPRPKVSYMTPPPNDRQQFDTNFKEGPIASTSAWVSSMAMAAENSLQNTVDAWTSPSILPQSSHPHPHWPTMPVVKPVPPHPVSAHPLPPKPPTRLSPLSRDLPEPHKPPPPPIGMQPDHDPSSKHGVFEPVSDSPTSRLPNPARTLVIEQLPKSHRNADWINSWCKTACGAHPVYFSINAQGAKALVEFATAELARKAWGSPRLGSNYAGLKSHQLKGKPREDLIKVWWYRIDGIGAGAGVGEIEEGEIEGDAAEKEVKVPVKKESKKERKARIVREKSEKQKKQRVVAKLSTEPHRRPQPTPITRPIAPLPNRPPQTHTSSLPSSHTSLPAHINQQINPPPSVSQSLPSSAVYHRHQPVSRPPLLPQLELRTQWREQPDSAKQIDKMAYGSSVRRQAPSVNGTESESIASSRSSSPIQLSPSAQELPPPTGSVASFGEHPDAMDVDDVDIGMDLSSPVNTRHPQPIPKSRSVSAPRPVLLSAPAPLHAPIPSPEPTSLTHVSATNTTAGASPVQNHLRPLSSASMHSSTPQGTPPLEPRAMKNAPKAPSYQKRSLLARKKELEERIARSRLELGLESNVTDSPPITPMSSSDLSVENHDSAEKDAMEERLRTLVLQSQRSKSKADIPPIAPIAASPSSQSTGAATSGSSRCSTGAMTLVPAGFSLDDLAVSFIQETIQTYKTSPQISPVAVSVSKPKPPPQVNSTTRLELAAKQKRLEQEIAETKILMAKLAQARTKHEKDSILAEMREKSRCVSSLPLAACSLAITNRLSIWFFHWFFLQGYGRKCFKPNSDSGCQRATICQAANCPGVYQLANVRSRRRSSYCQ